MNGFKILLVDDNYTAADVLGKLLTYKGHSVQLAHSGEEAVRAARENDPDIAIIDIGLPDRSGYEVARELRTDKTRALLIALTGFGQESDKKKAQEAGFDKHLTKPVGIKELENAFSAPATSAPFTL